MIVSQTVYIWFVTVMVFGVCVGWGAYDVVLLKRSLARGREGHDPAFGAAIGLVISAIGIIGVFRYHLGF